MNVTFPEEYQAENLAGKDAVFKVKIHEIKTKEVPALDDEFAKDVSEFDTLDELKADLKKQLSEKKAEEARRDLENQLLEQAIDGMEAEIPEVMFTKRADEMINDYAYRLQAQGIDLQTYLQYMGQDMDAFRATFKDGAEKQVKASLVLEAIVLPRSWKPQRTRSTPRSTSWPSSMVWKRSRSRRLYRLTRSLPM